MIILRYHEVFFRLAAPTAMPAHLGAYSLEKTSWYCNIIILLGVEEHPKYCWDFILWNDFNIVTFCNLYLPIYVVPIPNTYLVFVRSLSEYLLVKHFFFTSWFLFQLSCDLNPNPVQEGNGFDYSGNNTKLLHSGKFLYKKWTTVSADGLLKNQGFEVGVYWNFSKKAP